MNRFTIRAAALSLAVLAGPAWAQATNQSFTQTAAFVSPTGDNTTVSGTPVFLFNSTLGTLNSITFASSYGFTSTIQVSNPNPGPAGGNARTQSAAQFGASNAGIAAVLNGAVNTLIDPVDGNAVSFGGPTLSPIAYDLRGTRTIFNLTGAGTPGSTATILSMGSGNTSVVDTRGADLAAFTTAGFTSFVPTLSTLSALLISASPSAGGGESVAATGALSITYNYVGTAFTIPTAPITAAVPEAATWAMMMVGMGLVGGALRRRVSARVRFA